MVQMMCGQPCWETLKDLQIGLPGPLLGTLTNLPSAQHLHSCRFEQC